MKAKSESLGSGFYLSIILILTTLALWQILGPREADRELLARWMDGNINHGEHAPQKTASIVLPGFAVPEKAFAKALNKLAAEAENSQGQKKLFISLIDCSLQMERSLGQRFQCAQLAHKINRSRSNEYRIELGSAQKKWPRELKKEFETQF